MHARARAAAQSRVRAAVLAAFDAERLSESDLWGSFGYGYDDAARAVTKLCWRACWARSVHWRDSRS